jgi:hypothetical protein
MKLDLQTLVIGAAVITVAVMWSALERRGGGCGGRSCCPVIPGLSVAPSNSWVALESTNGKPGLKTSESSTNRRR